VPKLQGSNRCPEEPRYHSGVSKSRKWQDLRDECDLKMVAELSFLRVGLVSERETGST
jgi:hypothetical protein